MFRWKFTLYQPKSFKFAESITFVSLIKTVKGLNSIHEEGKVKR